MCGATRIYRRHVLSQRLLILLGLDVGDPDLGEQHAAPPGPLRGGGVWCHTSGTPDYELDVGDPDLGLDTTAENGGNCMNTKRTNYDS